MTPEQMYRSLFAGNTLRVKVEDERAFHSLRVALHKRHKHYTMLDLTSDKLSASWAEGFATFKLAPKTPPAEFEVEVM